MIYCKQGRKVINTNKCVQHHPSFISLLSHARQRLNLGLQWLGVVLTRPYRYNAVRGHRISSYHSEAEDYLRRKNKKKKRKEIEYLRKQICVKLLFPSMECVRALFSACFVFLFICEVAVGVGEGDEKDQSALTYTALPQAGFGSD